MDYTSLTEITKTIIALLQNAIDPGLTVKVLPELLRNDDLGVGFYLFHAQESPHYKNYPAPGKDHPAVSYTPMALNLFYQLSANWRENEKEDAYEEQRLMSIAMKTLHDHTVINSTNPGGKKINIKITLQTLSPSESVQYGFRLIMKCRLFSWNRRNRNLMLVAYCRMAIMFSPSTCHNLPAANQ
jgi:hypothetical protein